MTNGPLEFVKRPRPRRAGDPSPSPPHGIKERLARLLAKWRS